MYAEPNRTDLGIISTPLHNDDYLKFIQGEISRYGKIALENDISIN